MSAPTDGEWYTSKTGRRAATAPGHAMRSRRRSGRSISGPIILSSFAVALTAALLAGWIYVILKNASLTQWAATSISLLVVGIVSFATIIAVLVLFSVFLAREILEVRRQDTFLDSVTHELRSPLASLRLFLETLDRRELPAPKRTELRKMMAHDVERLSAFVDDILEASRSVAAGQASIAVDTVGLHALVEQVATQVASRHGIDVAGITIDVPTALTVETQRTALGVVLRNLLDNAVKYSNEPVEVVVRSELLPKGGLRIDVEDHGVGIPRRSLGRIFDRFYRVEDEHHRRRHGTGLGLFVVEGLVKRLRGKLRVHSDGPGQGTTMTVLLPRAPASLGAGSPTQRPTPSATETATPATTR